MRDRVRTHPWWTVYLVLGLLLFFVAPAFSPEQGVNIGLGFVAMLWTVPGVCWLLARLHRNLHPTHRS